MSNNSLADAHCCNDMQLHLNAAEVPLLYVSKFREYGLRVLDSGSSYITLTFCPWCGKELPSSMRDAWFDAIEGMGLEPESAELPMEYNSELWWRKEEEGKDRHHP